MSEPTCKDCKHWHKIDYNPVGPVVVDESRPGECRFNPPGIVTLRPGMVQCVYPTLAPNFKKCAQFSPRSEEAAAHQEGSAERV